MAKARDLLQSAEQEVHAASERLERVKNDYLSGELSATEWQELRGELEPDLSAAQAEEERLGGQLEEAESESALSEIAADLLTQLSEIRAEIAEEVSDAKEAAAVRAALMRLFDGFVLHRGSPRHKKREYIKVAYWLEPVLCQDQMGGYVDRLRAKLRTTVSGSPNGQAENNSDLAILFEVTGTTMPRDELLNRPCGGRFGNIVESIGNTPLVELPRSRPSPTSASTPSSRATTRPARSRTASPSR